MSYVFFLDESCPNSLRDALEGAGETVVLLKDHMNEGDPDEVWLKDVSERGWLMVTKDKAITRRNVERGAMVAAKGKLFVLVPAHMKSRELAELLVSALSRIKSFADNNEGPFIAKIQRGGRVERAWP